MSKRVCLTCEFFNQQEQSGVVIRCHLGSGGECRLNPPAIPLAYEGRHDVYTTGIWPLVFASYWCGQHRQRSAPRDRPPVPPAEVSGT